MAIPNIFWSCISLAIINVQSKFGQRSIFQIENYLALISKRWYFKTDMSKVKDEECIICLNPLTDEVDKNTITTGKQANTYLRTTCGHFFHPHCFVKSVSPPLKPVCPRCIQPHQILDQTDLGSQQSLTFDQTNKNTNRNSIRVSINENFKDLLLDSRIHENGLDISRN